MPYLETETVKAVRDAIKKEFKGYKFSITREHCTSLNINILESDIDFNLGDNKSTPINHMWYETHYPNNPRVKQFLKRIMEIIDSIKPRVTLYEDGDYGSIPNYYLSVSVGRWDRPYKLTGSN